MAQRSGALSDTLRYLLLAVLAFLASLFLYLHNSLVNGVTGEPVQDGIHEGDSTEDVLREPEEEPQLSRPSASNVAARASAAAQRAPPASSSQEELLVPPRRWILSKLGSTNVVTVDMEVLYCGLRSSVNVTDDLCMITVNSGRLISLPLEFLK
ncbi:unnamed protein product [Calypogeia fissa]